MQSLVQHQPSHADGRAVQQALRAVHDAGCLHGDLSDSNILFVPVAAHDSGSVAKLIDFGRAKTGASVEARQAEELQLATLFSAKVSAPSSRGR